MNVQPNDLTEEALINVLNYIKEQKGIINVHPEEMFIHPDMAQFLADHGYDTQEKILRLMLDRVSGNKEAIEFYNTMLDRIRNAS